MAEIRSYPARSTINFVGVRRIAYMSKDASEIVDSRCFPTKTLYVGATVKQSRYLGSQNDSSIYLGTTKIF